MDFISFIQSALSLKARQGWIFALVGTTMLLLVEKEIIPKQEIAAGWIALFYLTAVLGYTILAVDFGAYLTRRVKEHQVATEATRKAATAKQAANDLVLSNMQTLTPGEERALLWLMRRGNQKFSDYSKEITSLNGKKIVVFEDAYAPVYRIHDAVWALRDEFVEKRKHVPLPQKYPQYSNF